MISWSRLNNFSDLLDTQYAIYCITSNVKPSLIYWTVNEVKMSTTNYTLVNETDMAYNSTLLLFPNNEQGQSMNVTCSVEEVQSETITLEG